MRRSRHLVPCYGARTRALTLKWPAACLDDLSSCGWVIKHMKIAGSRICRAGDKDTGGALPALFQPFVHDQVICLAAPALAIFGADGQVRGIGAQGVDVADRRVLRMLVLRVCGEEPISCVLTGPGAARVVSVYMVGGGRHYSAHGAYRPPT